MKTGLTIAFLLILSITLQAQVDRDGPYILPYVGRTVSYSITDNVLKADTLKPGQSVYVRFTDHKDWDFSFKLHKTIPVPPAEYISPRKLIILSDIEGEFEAFRELMIGNKVIDKKYNWTFGKGHLVICGDLFDRGKDVMPYLWLLYKLEEDAAKNGGYVHVLLGNHDVMNMAGDLRYVAPKYQASAKLIGVDYLKLIGADTEIGKWLRSKNAIEKIGDKLFLHGGISPKINFLNLSLKAVNEKCRGYYGIPNKQLDEDGRLFMGSNGPFWYRGYFGKNSTLISTVDSTLKNFSANQIVVGHTITAENIASYYDRKVIGVDVDEHHGHHKALLYSNGEYMVVDEKGKKYPLMPAARAAEIQ